MVDVTQDNRKEAITWKNRGNSLAKQENFKSAISAYNTGIGLDPTNTDILHNKSEVLLKLERNDEAQECQRQIQELQNPPPVEVKPTINDFEVPITSPSPSKPRDIEDTPPVIQNEEINNPTKPGNVSGYCRFCGSGLQFKEADICPNCGMRLKEPQISIPQPLNIAGDIGIIKLPQSVTGKFADSCTSGCGTGVAIISGLIGLLFLIAGIVTIAKGETYFVTNFPYGYPWYLCLIIGTILIGFAIWLYSSTHASDKE